MKLTKSPSNAASFCARHRGMSVATSWTTQVDGSQLPLTGVTEGTRPGIDGIDVPMYVVAPRLAGPPL